MEINKNCIKRVKENPKWTKNVLFEDVYEAVGV